MTAFRWASTSGTGTVLRFNWPKFVAAAGVVVAAVLVAGTDRPLVLRAGLAVVGLVAATWSVTAVAATWWTYDHRRVYDRVGWALGEVGEWGAVHAGFDDATPRLAAVVGAPAVAATALSTPARRSLRRARRQASFRRVDDEAGRDPGRLPLATGSLDTIFVTMAVHEVRDRADQQVLFGELHRALRPGGRLVITEHHRGVVNASVFGPAAWHFQPRSTWLARAAEAGFGEPDELALTPFVHRMVWHRDDIGADAA